jgi:hypothetical protein
LFVKEHEGEFGESQKLEMSLTPDRVRKKIVEIPHSELSWAKKPEPTEGLPTMYITEQGMVSEEEWNEMEASHANPFIENYVGGGFPTDRLVVLRDDYAEEYPLDFPVYDAKADISTATIRLPGGRTVQAAGRGAKAAGSRWKFWKK